jgi:hypothetical protein
VTGRGFTCHVIPGSDTSLSFFHGLTLLLFILLFLRSELFAGVLISTTAGEAPPAESLFCGSGKACD